MNKQLRVVTKQNPCPHCGKPDWCYSIGNLSVCNRDNPPADGWYQTGKTDRDGHSYYAPIQDLPEKQPRQSKTWTWEYLDLTGNKSVRLVRIDPQKIIWQEYWLEHPDLAKFRTEQYWVKLSQKDYDKGKCTESEWELFNQLKEEKRQHIPIYRYHEIQEAIKQNKTIFIVEGESCADKLWELGIPATNNIGGSKKWRSSNTQDLIQVKSEAVNIVLCPDRDKPGLEHMERIYQDFPNAQWLYAFPQSPLWNLPLPLSDGLDIADWIDELSHSYRLDRSEIIRTIYQSIQGKSEKVKVKSQNSELNTDLLNQSLSVNNDNNVNKLLSNSVGVSNSDVNKSVNNPVNNRQQSQQINEKELIAKLHEIINIAPKKSTITTLFFQLSKSTGRSVNQIEKLYNELVKEVDREYENPIRQQEITQLLTLESTHLDLADYLPVEMVKPLNHMAEILGSNSLSQLTALLPVVGSLVNPNTKLILIKSSKFYARPIFYSAIVGESGSAKSPTMSIFTDPLTQYMQGKAENVYQHQLTEYETIKANKSIETKPPKPKAIEYYVTDCTSECVAQIINDQPNKGFLMLFDELSGLIKQNNAYRGGKGADQEKILSGRDGTGWKVNRKSGDRFNNSRSTYSILGAITPDILRQQMGSCQDESGYWARFVYSYLPVKKCKFPDDELNIDIYPMLCSLYENLERLPTYQYHLCPVGTAIYQDFFNEMEEKKITDSNQAMRAIYSKFKRVAGEIALLLQSLHKAFYQTSDDDDDNRTTYIAPEFMAMGVELAKRYIAEIKAIYLRHEGSDEKNISPIYSRIINLSQRKGWLTARELKQGDRFFRKLSTVDIRHHFQNMIDLGFGVIRGVGKAVEWCFNQVKSEKVKVKSNDVDQNVDTTVNTQNYSYAYSPPDNQVIREKLKVKSEETTQNTCSSRSRNNVDNVDTVVDAFVDNQNQSKTIANSEIQKSHLVNVDNVDKNQVKKVKSNNFDSIVCSTSDSEPYDPSDILSNSEVRNQNSEVKSSASKYHGLYAIVPKQYSKRGILVDLREQDGYLIGRQSGMSKFVKVPLLQVIEYKQEEF
ncbi:DUF3987 domain-containing protein [Geminocystis sp. GBBB08]|uniref:DUF3987 domain-containing protein n=1 Tax=Geminocystis sp. GBBB08 TaxID=2604140 RepID=UPI0027E35191|nr:DUF3987 domain-containing protein [Geminocystis sp. GBBB08]MBL1208292.1 DUF3987 domain-containing protein [Geminocystis sp. GBBB08]